MNKSMTVFFICLFHQALCASGQGIEVIKETVGHYQKSEAVSASINKNVTLALLDEKKKSSGQFLFSKGNLRIEIQKPEESLIVMSESTVWVVTPAPKDLGGKLQVLKIKATKNMKSAKAPIATLLSSVKAWDQFVVKNEKTDGDKVNIQLVPRKPESMGEVVSVSVLVDKIKKEILSLSYKDELDNETRFDFKDTNFKATVEKAKFQYKPPAGAEVTEY